MSPFNTQQLATVPLSLFGGLIAETDPSDAPEGSSPLLQDCEFDVGSVRQRRGLAQILSTAGITNGSAANASTFVLQNQDVQTLVFAQGPTAQPSALAFEDVTNSPGTLTLLATNFAQYMKVANFGGRAFMAFSDGTWGADVPLKYKGAGITRISQDGPGANATAADSGTAGNISAGLHQLAVSFLTSDGYLTRPSPIGSWTAAGSKRVSLTNLPIGPANVVARVILFTAAGASFFFYIPIPTTGSVTGTVVNDNTSTTATLDFTDTALQAATSVDTAGNNLFALDTLGNCLGAFTYSNRTLFWGERNKIQNLLNPSFDGGFDNATNTTPLGWTQDTTGGAKVATQTGFAYQITVGVTIGTHYGQIHQGAASDSFNAPIFSPNTQYVFRAQLSALSGQSATAVLSSSSTGFTTSATITASPLFNGKAYQVATFNLALPAVIPSDLILTVYANSTGIATTVTLDELEFYPANNPFLGQQVRVSYANNPESFDGVTGIIGLAEAGSENIKRLFQIRETLYIQTDGAIYATSDNGLTEPSGWSIEKVSNTVGTVSAFSGTSGEEFDFSVHRTGLYVFTGGEPTKSNQEIFRSVSGLSVSWEQINWTAAQAIWVANDVARRQLYIGVPIGANTLPSTILMMDYKELNSASQISSEGPVHTSYSGKVISWEPGRKWSPWNIAALSGNMCRRPDGTYQLLVGVGALWLQPTEGQYSDNGAAINSFYTTYGFPPADFANQNPMLGVNRLLYSFLTMYVSGNGTLNITAFPSSLTNSIAPAYALLLNNVSDPTEDMEVPIRAAGERCFFRVGTNAVGSFWSLSKLTARMRSHPWSRIRHVN